MTVNLFRRKLWIWIVLWRVELFSARHYAGKEKCLLLPQIDNHFYKISHSVGDSAIFFTKNKNHICEIVHTDGINSILKTKSFFSDKTEVYDWFSETVGGYVLGHSLIQVRFIHYVCLYDKIRIEKLTLPNRRFWLTHKENEKKNQKIRYSLHHSTNSLT